MKTLAAIVRENGSHFQIEEVDLEDPRDDEVLVKIVGVGVCHTDLVFREGAYLSMPAVLGHEGAGIVERVGSAVTKVAPGDRVVLTFRSCGECTNCRHGQPAYCAQFGALNARGRRPDGSCAIHGDGGEELGCNFFGQSSFSQHALAYERNLVKVRTDAQLEMLGPLGCGVQTGAGGTMRTLACRAGSSILILGAGAVGMSALLGAVVQGCTTIIVSEPLESRRQLALELGATHVIDSRAGDLPLAVRAIVPGGVNYAFDTSGRGEVIVDAILSLATLGSIALVGIPEQRGSLLSVSMETIVARGLTIRGVVEGDSDPDTFIPQLIDLWLAGRFPMDRIISVYPLSDINEAVEDQLAGRCIKAVLLT